MKAYQKFQLAQDLFFFPPVAMDVYIQGMLKFTLKVIIETAKNISRDSKRMEILHHLYQLLGMLIS